MGRGEERFEQTLGLLPEGWEAKELGALRRARKIQTPEELLRLILLYLTEGKSFAGTSAIAALSGEPAMSKAAAFKRMRASASWLQWLCENAYRKGGLTSAKPKWLKKKSVILADGTEDVKCGVRRQCYMLHYSLDLFALAAREFLVTDRRTGEKLASFKQLGKGDIVMGNRAYGTLPGIAYILQRKADCALRVNCRGFAIYDGKNRKIDLRRRLSRLKEGKTADIAEKCGINGRHEPFRVCALRKDTDSERAGLKRLAKTNQRKRGGKAVSELQRENDKYIIVAASLKKEEATAA